MARWRPTPHLDPSELERGIDRGTLRRAWAFARPYRGLLALQLAGAGDALKPELPIGALVGLIDEPGLGAGPSEVRADEGGAAKIGRAHV